MKNKELILHGECMVFPTEASFDGLKKKNADGKYFIVADSETTGNHHVVDLVEGADFFENDSGTLFMKSSVETKIRCLHADRHDEIVLPAGNYEFGTQQEYDPFLQISRDVRD